MSSDTATLIKQIAIDGATSYAASRISKARNNAVIYAVTGALVFLTTIFVSIAVFCTFAQLPQFATAGLYTAVLVFVLAAAFYVFAKLREKSIQREIHNEKIWVTNAVDLAGDILAKEIEGPIRENPKTALLIAGLVGFAATKRYL
ncbi:MAG: hypothetical protein AB7E85_08080 [Pseudobdellovibrionaceae bacterium]